MGSQLRCRLRILTAPVARRRGRYALSGTFFEYCHAERQEDECVAPPNEVRENVVHCRLYMSLATASARVHPAPLPRASSRLARAKAAAKFACARCWARLTELGVGWRSICASIDCGPNGPAFGLAADCRTASSNCAILVLQGPACADEMPKPKAATQRAAAIRRSIKCSQRRGCKGWAFESGLVISKIPCHSRSRPNATIRKISGQAQKGALLVRPDKHHHGTTQSITTGGSDECGGPQGGS
jgi:hypothetical protein